MEGAEEEPLVQCPVCLRELPGAHINSHLDRCLQAGEAEAEPGSSPPCKRPRIAAAPPGSQAQGEPEAARPAPASPHVFSLFHKGRGGGQSPAAAGRRSGAGQEEAAVKPEEGGSAAAGSGAASLAQKLEGKPLAERLRPDTLGDYVGQERVLGAQTLLRSLLESHEIPSLIFWGPPGCGKVSGAAGPRRRCLSRPSPGPAGGRLSRARGVAMSDQAEVPSVQLGLDVQALLCFMWLSRLMNFKDGTCLFF